MQRLHDYADAQAAYQQKLDEIRERQAGIELDVQLPDPPAEPAPFTLYSTEVGRGFPLQLSAGEYTIRVRDANGQIVPDSEKRLVAFGPRRLGVGYEVHPARALDLTPSRPAIRPTWSTRWRAA